MKKIATLILILIIIVFVIYGCNTVIDKTVTDRTIHAVEQAGEVRTVACTAIAEDNNTVTLQDEQGWLWQVEDDTIAVGDDAIVWLVDNGTINDLTDDRVVYTVRITQ